MKAALARRDRLLLDGGMGTALLARGFDPARETAASWNVSRPAEVRAIHAEHVAAGAQVVLTNTFGRAAPSVDECEAAVRLARESHARYVAGSLWAGAEGLARGVEALGSADAIWLETATSPDQAKAALAVALARTRLPVIVTLAVFPPPPLDELRAMGAAAVGLNCSPWPRGGLARLSRGLDVLKPDAAGLSPRQWADELRGCEAPLVGGCCGATAAHLASLRETPR